MEFFQDKTVLDVDFENNTFMKNQKYCSSRDSYGENLIWSTEEVEKINKNYLSQGCKLGKIANFNFSIKSDCWEQSQQTYPNVGNCE